MEAMAWKMFIEYHQSNPAWAFTTHPPHVAFLIVPFPVLFHPSGANVGKLPVPVPVTKGARTVVGMLWPMVVEFAYMAAPVSTTTIVSELPAVGYNPPVPGGN